MGQIRTRAIRSAFDVHRASQLRRHPRLQLLLEVLLDREVGRSQSPADGELKVFLAIWDGRICERDAPDVGLTSNREHVEYLQLQSELAQRFVRAYREMERLDAAEPASLEDRALRPEI